MRRHDGLMESCEAGTEVLAAAVSACAEPMPAEAREAVRTRLAAAIAPEAVPLRVRMLRPAVALMTAGSVLGGVSYAAAASAPGDVLYPVKRSVASACRGIEERVMPKAARPEAAAEGRKPATAKPKAPRQPGTVEPKQTGSDKPSAVTTPGQGVKGGGQGRQTAPGRQKDKQKLEQDGRPKTKSLKKSNGNGRSVSRGADGRPSAASKR